MIFRFILPALSSISEITTGICVKHFCPADDTKSISRFSSTIFSCRHSLLIKRNKGSLEIPGNYSVQKFRTIVLLRYRVGWYIWMERLWSCSHFQPTSLSMTGLLSRLLLTWYLGGQRKGFQLSASLKVRHLEDNEMLLEDKEMLLFPYVLNRSSQTADFLREKQEIGLSVRWIVDYRPLRHTPCWKTIYLFWEVKSIAMQKYFIVLSSNMALCRRGLLVKVRLGKSSFKFSALDIVHCLMSQGCVLVLFYFIIFIFENWKKDQG